MARVTISDVAREMQMSVATVSRALNNTGRVSPETRARALEAAARIGFVPNPHARRLRGVGTGLIGVVVFGFSTAMFEIARGAHDAARASGREISLQTSTAPDTEHRRVRELGSGLADGVLVLWPTESDEELHSLRSLDVPVVLVGHRHLASGLSTVYADNVRGSRRAAEHLLALGHRRIAYITGKSRTGQSQERVLGYQQALREAGVVDVDEYVVPGDFGYESGVNATHDLLDRRNPPTAVMAAGDEMALGVLEAAQSRALVVPDDLSVIGFNDEPGSSLVRPGLTTVRHPLFDLGHTGVSMLLEMMAAPGEARLRQREVELRSTLVVRGTTRPPAGARG